MLIYGCRRYYAEGKVIKIQNSLNKSEKYEKEGVIYYGQVWQE